jgi:NADH:ubiquinone oxidoreductase subunit 2 (subunit N)
VAGTAWITGASSGIDAGFAWLAVVAILNSVLSLAVYLRIVVPMYRAPKEVPVSARSVTTVWTIALVITVAVGLAAQVLLKWVA